MTAFTWRVKAKGLRSSYCVSCARARGSEQHKARAKAEGREVSGIAEIRSVLLALDDPASVTHSAIGRRDGRRDQSHLVAQICAEMVAAGEFLDGCPHRRFAHAGRKRSGARNSVP